MLIPVQYHRKQYPSHIKPYLVEGAGHFDANKAKLVGNICLHTEYSYGRRKLTSVLLQGLQTIRSAHRDQVPMLWYDTQWAVEFAHFIFSITENCSPKVIEIHPPFDDYTDGIDAFLTRYKVFEDVVRERLPEVEIVIENRSGTLYKGGKFVISKIHDLCKLTETLDQTALKLCIALDIPQLLTEYGGPAAFSPDSMKSTFSRLLPFRHRIKSIHLWGKKRSSRNRIVSHAGDLNTYFDNDMV